MMKTKSLLLSLLILFLLSACNKDETPEPDSGDPFLGQWEIVAATGLFADDNMGTVYTFKADGTLTIRKGFSSSGTYTRTDTEISYEIGGIELNYTYTLSGNSMTWDNTTADQTFEFEKR